MSHYLEELGSYITDSMIQWAVPGAAVVIVKDGETVFMEGFGRRAIDAEERVGPDTQFAIASITKGFTATALAILVEEGKLTWDTPVQDVLPGFRLHDPWVSGKVTVRDILCHRTGLPGSPLSWYGSELFRSELVRRIRHLEPATSFRSAWAYQNVMYVAAGEIVAHVSGQSWDDFVRDRIFMPLGMTNTVTSIGDVEGADNLAMPHEHVDDVVQRIPWYRNDNAGPAGSIISNTRDMAKWLQFLLDPDATVPVSRDVLAETHTPQMLVPLGRRGSITMPETDILTYGFGWFMSDYRKSGRIVEHGGNICGMHSLASLMPDKRVGIVTLTNYNPGMLPEAIRYRLFDAVLGHDERDWSEELHAFVRQNHQEWLAAKDDRETRRVKDTSPSLPLEAYAGKYANPVLNDASVETADGELVFRYGREMVGTLRHWQYDTFRTDWHSFVLFGEQLVTFSLNADGKVERLQLGNLATFCRAQ